MDIDVSKVKDVYEKKVEAITDKRLTEFMRMKFVDNVELKRMFEANDEKFVDFCVDFSSRLEQGKVLSTTYAAVVSVIAKKLGKTYKAYAGFCIPKSSPAYNTIDKGSILIVNHVYITVDGKDYEYLNGATSDIEHVNVVEI